MVLGYFKYNIRVWRLPCPACPLASAQVIDEEKSQTKGLLYLIQIVGATAFIEHDSCHTYWNIFKRSTARSKLSLPVLKATIACNSTIKMWCFIVDRF